MTPPARPGACPGYFDVAALVAGAAPDELDELEDSDFVELLELELSDFELEPLDSPLFFGVEE